MTRLVVAGLALMLASCGYIGPIQPPALDIPQHISDLRAAEFGEKIVVEFTIPPLTTEGLPLRSVRSAELAVGVGPNPFSMNAWAASAKKYDAPATGPGPLTREIPAGEWVGKDVVIAVHAVGPKGKSSDWSNLATLSIRAPLPKPADLRAENVRDGIEVDWSGAPGQHFHVYRASGAETPALIATADQPQYLDSSVDFGAAYRYYVDRFEGTRQSSETAESATVAREDVFAPSAPTGVTAELGSASVELSWERNTDARFQGYNVFRSVNGGPFEKVATLIPAPSYTDRDVQRGKTYRYEISAVGVNGRESTRSATGDIAVQ